jgi:hypothetical protein
MPALSNSLASDYQVNNSWLTNDTSNPTGKGPVTTGPTEPISDPANGTAPVALNPSPFGWQESELAEQAPDYFSESAFPHAGPWPGIPEEWNGKEPFGTLPDDGITPIGYYKVPPKVTGFVHNKELYPGHDRHSQDVDDAGWEQYTPSGRTAIRQDWEQSGYYGVDYYWPTTQPTYAPVRIARGGNQEINGSVAEYGGIYNSGGNTAYTEPTPPATTTIPVNQGTSTIPQWGM